MAFVYKLIYLLQIIPTANDFHPFSKFMNRLTSGAIDPFPDAVVSLWRLDSAGRVPQKFICVAALITPNYIFTIKVFLNNIRPLKTIGFYTGRSFRESKRMENSVIIDEIYIHKIYTILIVRISV